MSTDDVLMTSFSSVPRLLLMLECSDDEALQWWPLCRSFRHSLFTESTTPPLYRDGLPTSTEIEIERLSFWQQPWFLFHYRQTVV